MQKIFTAIVAASAAFVSACSASSEKGANREYVGASANVERAEKAFAEADYKTAKALCDNAVASVRKIVEKYPESTIALKVMTDSDTRIGPVAYFDLVSKIIPKLGLLYNPNLAEVGIAWPVAVNGGLRGGDVCALAALVQAAAADGKISEEAQKRISAELAKAVSDVFDKSRIERGDFSDFAALRVEPPAGSSELFARSTPKPLPRAEKIADKKLFISETRTQAAMVAYDISVIPALRAKAVSAKADSPELFAEFVKILDGALDNVSKINAPQIRDKAYADMSALFADVGMENKAIELARKVSEARLFEGTFAKIASTAGNSENYMDAIALASRMPDGRRKNDFLSDLAAGVARRGYFEAAFSIAETIKDPAARDYSHARIAAAAFGKKPKALARAASKVSLAHPEVLEKISPTCAHLAKSKYARAENPELYRAAALADFAYLAASADKALCEKINGAAIAELKDAREISPVAIAVARNFAEAGNAAAAIDFVAENIYRAADFPRGRLCALSAEVAKSNPQAAKKGFEISAGLVNTGEDAVILAWNVANSGLPLSSQVQILKPFLPQFGK